MTLVVDASAVAGWLLPDENGPDLAALVATHADFLALGYFGPNCETS